VRFKSTGCAGREDSAICLLEIVSHHPDLVLCSPLGDTDSELPTLCGTTNDEFKAYILDRNQKQIIASIDSGGHIRRYKPAIDIPQNLQRPIVTPVTEEDAEQLQRRARAAPVMSQREQVREEQDIFRELPPSNVSTRPNIVFHDDQPFGLQESKTNDNNTDSSSMERMLQEVRERRESSKNNNNNPPPTTTSSSIRSSSSSFSTSNANLPPVPPIRTNTSRSITVTGGRDTSLSFIVTGGSEADNWYVSQ
jgi:hypothetical protein